MIKELNNCIPSVNAENNAIFLATLDVLINEFD
jgi:hypothetical protein